MDPGGGPGRIPDLSTGKGRGGETFQPGSGPRHEEERLTKGWLSSMLLPSGDRGKNATHMANIGPHNQI